MSFGFTLPDLGEGIAEAEVMRWHVEPGRRVSEGDPLVDVETDKAIVEIPSPRAGTIERLAAEVGDRVPVGALLVEIGIGDGREPTAGPEPSSGEADAPAGAGTGASKGVPNGRPEPIRGVRRTLARRLSRVQRDVPAVTVVEECDFTELDAAHDGFERSALMLKAVSAALADVPELNATFADCAISRHVRHDIGFAVQTGEGLLVPVVRDVASRPLDELGAELVRLTAGARDGWLAPAELRGSTFTVTDPGPFGGILATPLINAPEIAVLGLHRVEERPVARDGRVALRRVGNVSCTFDHRAVDGFHAGAFLLRLKELVEAPRALADEGEAPGGTGPARRERIAELVRDHVLALAGEDVDFDPDAGFKDLGLSSKAAVELRNRLARDTGLRLPSTLAFDHPTPAAVVDRLLAEVGGGPAASPRPRRLAAAAAPDPSEPIAILGMACRFPGGVASPGELWDLLVSATDAISPFPNDRGWDLERLSDPDLDRPGVSRAREGGFLEAAADFDAGFFGISPREALAMDPQQRLLLETAWEALEDAGIDPSSLGRTPAGVFAGVIPGEYGGAGNDGPPELAGLHLTGGAISVASGRVAYALGLEGPALTVDTACSSSLVALHLGVQALQRGECSLALAGGATVLSTPMVFTEFSRQGGLAPDGRCKSFSSTADGVGFSEGVGTLLLERLSDARANGHPVLATIRGSAVNQDGASNGLTAPNGPSQGWVIRQALANAGLRPGDVDTVEAHGTGTTLGDPIEAGALFATYGREHSGAPLLLGSIKSNIGHAQAAAGVAGVIKMVLAMRHGELPRTLHVDAPTPHVDWSAGGVELLTEARPWPRGERPRRAGVSSFGISGTNAHLILEEAPDPPPLPAGAGEEGPAEQPPLAGPLPLFLSAKSEPALRESAARLASRLEEAPGLEPVDVGFSLVAARALFERRAAVIGSTREELLAGLGALGRGEPHPHLFAGRARGGKLAFLLTGQGAQRPGMGGELYAASPPFAAALEEACAALDPHLERPLRGLLFAAPESPEAALLDRTAYTQPALFALEVALFRLLERLGIAPDFLIGHSIGEIAAAHLAGVLSLADAARLVAGRGALMEALPGGGAMAAIEASEEEVAEALRGREAEVSIAALNGPRKTVVSGAERAVAEIVAGFEAEGRRAKRLAVSHAFHSPLMEPMLDDFAALAAELDYGEPRIPIVSNLNGCLLAPELAADPDYWVSHVREPVRFAAGIATLGQLGVATYMELGPDAVLSAMAASCLDGAEPPAATIPLLRAGREEPESFAAALAAAHVAGVGLERARLYPGAERVELPTYAFQRERYWVESPGAARGALAAGPAAADHPLLDTALDSPDGSLRLSGRLSRPLHPWLADHVIAGAGLLPGSAFLELALAAAARVGAGQVEELILEAPLVVPEREPSRLQVTVGAEDERGRREIEIHLRPEGDSERRGEWTRHARGALSAARPAAADSAGGPWPPEGAVEIELAGLYERLAARGYEYGPAFRGLTAAWRDGETVYAEVSLPEPEAARADRFGIHPALLDAALHVALLHAGPAEAPRLPFAFSAVRAGEGRGAGALRVRIAPAGGGVAVEATGPDGALACSIGSLASRPVDPSRLVGSARPGSLFAVEWSEVALDRDREGSGAVEVFSSPPRGTGESAPDAALDRSVGLLERLRAFLVAGGNGAGGRFALLTGGAVATGEEEAPYPAAAALWGLVRSAQSEHPDRFLLVDSDGSEASRAALSAALASGEPRLALREGRALAPRLVPADGRPGHLMPPPSPWRLGVPEPGTLEGLALVPAPEAARPLGPTEVRIAMHAAGLNFRDVMVALGSYPGPATLGGEGAGVVVEVGSEVGDLTPGDRAMGLFAESFGPLAVAERGLLAPVPPDWSFEQAAATPIAFLTAYYGLCDLGGLKRGEKVLIHAGAGGVGMAAIQIARHLGAEVFATAGPGKREALRDVGVPGDRIASSRDLGFAREFAGQGFDVILNALAGEFVDASLGLLGAEGRFLELGKTDVRDRERVAVDHPGVSYRAFDLFQAGPERLGEALAELLGLFARGALRHPPISRWAMTRAPAAFRHLREGLNVGKVVLDLPSRIDPGATVLITGGTGALGTLLARHLVERYGARRLLLAGRAGPAAAGAAELRAELEGLGARVDLVACDVAVREEVAALLDSIPAEHPLGAVIHAAGVLDDATIESLDAGAVERVFAPKVAGAWNLHELTAGLRLSHFVLFSSAAGFLGAPGQGGYAAANTFLDALAQRRHAEGLPATSIAWGPWEQGMTARLAEADRARMRRNGLEPLSEERALALFDTALDAGLPLALALRRPAPAAPAQRQSAASALPDLDALDPAEQERALLDLVCREAAAVLGHDSAAAVEPGSRFRDLGFDSLAAVELRNRLAVATGLTLEAALAFDYPTSAELAEYLLAELAPAQRVGDPMY